MNPLDRIAEERLKRAVEEGVFEDVAGMGAPLELEDLSRVPEDLRAVYLLLKGSGHLPEEMSLKMEILSLGDLIRACTDDGEARRLRERRSALTLRFSMLMERRGNTTWVEYARELRERLG